MGKQPVALSPETKALLEQLIRERDAAVSRLDVALLATKAALGVPKGWQIHSLDEGFTDDAIAPQSA